MLLLGAGLAEVLNAVFPVLACRKPANTILVPTKSAYLRFLQIPLAII